CPCSSARAPTRFTNSSACLKSGKVKVRARWCWLTTLHRGMILCSGSRSFPFSGGTPPLHGTHCLSASCSVIGLHRPALFARLEHPIPRTRNSPDAAAKSLERNILIRDRPGPSAGGLMLGHTLVEAVAVASGGRCAARTAEVAACAFAAAAQQNQVAGHDLCHVFLLPAGLVIPGAGLQTTLDIDLAALLEIFAGDFGLPLPEDDVVPFGAVLPLAALVFEAFVGGDRDLRYRRALRGVLNFWIFSQITNQLNSVQASSCHGSAPWLAL